MYQWIYFKHLHFSCLDFLKVHYKSWPFNLPEDKNSMWIWSVLKQPFHPTKDASFPDPHPSIRFNHLFFQHIRQESWLPPSTPPTKEGKEVCSEYIHKFTSLINGGLNELTNPFSKNTFLKLCEHVIKYLDTNVNIIPFNSQMFAIL